jgi:hypothetical protein
VGLKSREWFFGECYKQVRKKTKLEALADRVLELGFKKESTGGHILQACGATQLFLQKRPEHIPTIRSSSPKRAYRLRGQILDDWLEFFQSKKHGKPTYGQKQFQYNWRSLNTYLTPKYGGRHRGGGGGNDKLERVMRLMAEFM